MTVSDAYFYSPALRMKKGELSGLRRLAADIRSRVRPRLIVPPRKERDGELAAALLEVEEMPNTAAVLGEYCAGMSVLLDASYLFKDFGEESAEKWLPQMFEATRLKRMEAVPVASISDLLSSRAAAFKNAMASSGTRLAVRFEDADFLDLEKLRDRLATAIDFMEIDSSDLMAIADFKSGGFEAPSMASGVIEGAIEAIQEFGMWECVAFQGSNYPLKNPAGPDEKVTVPRNEWLAWKEAVQFSGSTPTNLLFGDYAADHPRMEFKSGGARPHRHYRYSTPESWLVVRGPDGGSDASAMMQVGKKIVDSGHFAGRGFSSADEYIFQTSLGEAVGNATNWREMNTCHHITRVVRDIGAVRGIEFSQQKVEVDTQGSLF